MRALIVDDDPEILAIITEVLASNNFETETTENPREALEVLKTESFHVIVTDLQMPDMDGFELAAAIVDMGVKTPVIGISGLPEGGKELLSKKDGKNRLPLDLILKKPFEYEDFYDAIGHVSDKIDYKLA